MSQVEARVEKLSAKNYTSWKVVMSSLLKSRKLWEVCSVKSESPIESEAEMVKNEEAKHLMYVSMDASQIAATGSCETAYDLWIKIKENHEGAEKNLRNTALADFLGLRYKRDETLLQFCGRFENALGRLTSAGHVVDEATKVWVFSNTLPKTLRTAAHTWAMVQKDGKVVELMSELKIQYHMDRDESKDNTAALYGQSTDNRRQANHNTNNNKRDGTKYCTWCKANNHVWKECKKLKEHNERKKKFGQKNQVNNRQKYDKNERDETTNHKKPEGKPTSGGSFMAFESDVYVPFTPGPNYWIVDSGCTRHMTSHKEFITDYEEFDSPSNIILGDGKSTSAFGKGRIPFTTGEFTGELCDVYWVPELKENLFSIGRAMALGCEVKFRNKPAEVLFLKEDKVRLRGKRVGKGLFVLKLLPQNCKVEMNDEEDGLAAVSFEEWHRRFAHCSLDTVKQLANNGAVKGLTVKHKQHNNCIDCAHGKICRSRHPTRRRILASDSTAILHFDTSGKIGTPSLGGRHYFVLCTEEYSDYKIVGFVTIKSAISDLVKQMINRVELESKRPVRMIITDNGTEYCNNSLCAWLNDKGILHETSVAHTPEQNGRAERANRTIIEATRTLLSSSKLGEEFWAEAANTAVYTLNRTLSSRNKEKTRYELYFKERPDVRNLRIFGQHAVVRLEASQRPSKWSPKGEECIFVGYTERWNTYRFYSENVLNVFVSCDAVFISPDDIPQKSKPATQQPAEESEVELTLRPPNEGTTDESFISNDTVVYDADGANDSQSGSTQYDSSRRPVTRSMTSSVTNFINNTLFGNSQSSEASELAGFTLDDEPMTLKDAQERSDWPKWQQAMKEELEALHKNNTWVLVPRPSHVKPIKCKWVYKIKLDPQGNVERYKARLVAKGYSQVPNRDYKETFAPVAGMTTIRLLFAIANQQEMRILQFDVKTAFLYGDLDETIYMEFPEGYPNPKNQVCKLVKSLYGLKQAPRQWNIKFDKFLKRFQLHQSMVDKCLYYNPNKTLILVIYVDDGLVASCDKNLLDNLIDYLKSNFELKTMECESYLGFQVARDWKSRTLRLSQDQYVTRMLEKFGMSDCKPASTPEEVTSSTTNDEDSKLLTNDYPFKELVGSLLYLVTCTRPDIAHAVSIASRTSEPTIAHWKMLKRILRYLKGTKEMSICFRWEKSPKLVGYSDADYANDIETRRSTTGFVIMYGHTPIAWRCQRQSIVTLSTTEAEYVSGCELVKEILPIRELMLELNQIDDEPITVYIDNLSTVRIAKNDGGQQRTKHIDVRHKWLSEQVEKKKITVEHVFGDQQAADMLTKPLHKTKFSTNRSLLVTMAALLAMVMTVSAHKFTKVDPLYFKPSKFPYFSGDTEFNLKLIFQNPCPIYFHKLITLDRVDGLEEGLRDECNESYNSYILGAIETNHRCRRVTTNTTKVQRIDSNDKTSLDRSKRFAPVLYLLGLIVVAGISAHASIQAETNRVNIDNMAGMLGKQRELLDEGARLYQHIMESIEDIHTWSGEIATKLKSVERFPGLMPRVAALVNDYLSKFEEQRNILWELEQSAQTFKLPASLRTLSNVTLWEEPAAEWSNLNSCTYDMENGSLAIRLHFNMPTVDHRIKIMQAVPLNFYNGTTSPDGKNMICWMKYRGPEFVLVNTTNDCMTEVYTNSIHYNVVRSQTCQGKEDELKPEEINLWEKELPCTQNPQPSKRRIQDREFGGLHRIYCLPFNITIENSTYSCPDYVFELEGRTTYRIANIEHYGRYIDKTVIKSNDLHINKGILEMMKADRFQIRTMNSTALKTAYGTYFAKLQDIPKSVDLKKVDWQAPFLSTFQSLKKFGENIWSYIEELGMIMGIIAGGVLLIVVAPVIEVLVLGFKILRFVSRGWLNGVTGIASKLQLKRRERKYWEEGYKRV